MKNFLKNATKDIIATKTFFEAGIDIPKLKNQRDKLNKDYQKIVEQHNLYLKFLPQIEIYKSTLESKLQMKVRLEQAFSEDDDETYLQLIVEIDKIINSLKESLRILNVGMNDENFENETNEYQKELKEIETKLKNARSEWY